LLITERKQAESLQAALYAISEAAHNAEDLPSLFQLIHQIIGKLLSATNFSVAMYDERNDQLSFPYYTGDFREAPELQQTAVGALCAEVIRTRQSLLLGPESLATFPDGSSAIRDSNAVYWLVVPLNSHTGTIGALIFERQPGRSTLHRKGQGTVAIRLHSSSHCYRAKTITRPTKTHGAIRGLDRPAQPGTFM
jgi:transcriptional regulator with GAF, ATPase, and Fis domain